MARDQHRLPLAPEARAPHSSATKLVGPPPLPTLAPHEELDVELTLAEAIVRWWEGRRPMKWTVRQHIETYAVNTSGPTERRLAYLAAAWVRTKGQP